LSQPDVARDECDVKAPSDDDVERVGHRDVVSHAPRLAKQRCRVDAADPEGKHLIKRRLRIGGRQLAAKLHAPQGGSALKVKVVRDSDLVGIQDVPREAAALIGPQHDLNTSGGIEDDDRHRRAQTSPSSRA
jgi:hypothetical protein